jgi:hypothetical protein
MTNPPMPANTRRLRLKSRLDALRARGLVVYLSFFVLVALALGVAAYAFIQLAVPDTLTITAGPKGSSFYRTAEKYKKILARDGVTLNILESDGSPENLQRLSSAQPGADIGFVLGGELKDGNAQNLMSLGSINYQPLMIFYHGKVRHLLSDFAGARIDIGAPGSGTRTLALDMLKANGIEPQGATRFIEVDAKDPEKDLNESRLDVIFMMGDSTSSKLMRQLLRSPKVHLFNVTQADAYARRIGYLNKLVLPMGSLDLGKNLPAQELNLVAPTVELIARDSLHPALSDLLLEAAREVHSGPGLFKKRGEFPVPLEHEFRMSPDAVRYFTSGKTYLYRTFPFWLASLLARALAVLVPLALVLVPALRFAPTIYRWRIESRIHRWYKVLLDLERDTFVAKTPQDRADLLRRLDAIEASVNRIVIPASFGDMFYDLRGHVDFVRNRLMADAPPPTKESA